MENPEPKLADVLAQQRTDLAVERTILASINSLQAWIRTALSMIGFGFTIYKFLQAEGIKFVRPQTPRNMGLFLIGMGTLSIIFGVFDYWFTHKELRRKYGFRIKIFPVILALLIGVLGLVLFITIILRIEIV